MAEQAMVKEVIKGAYDMHIHSAPDVLLRKFKEEGLPNGRPSSLFRSS